MVKLGSYVKDIVSGFSGYVMARAEYFNGCIRYNVQPDGLKEDGSLKDDIWFDSRQVQLVGDVEPLKRPKGRTEGPPTRGDAPLY